jgi:hypothetical protein
LVQHQVEPSIYQPLSHKPGRADVIMLNQQGAHPPESNLDPNDCGPLSCQHPTLRGMHALYMACNPSTA